MYRTLSARSQFPLSPDCQVGFDITTGGTGTTQTVGAEVILDSQISNTPIAIRTSASTTTSLAGSLLIDNLKLSNVATAAVADAAGHVLVAGGTTTIGQWAQGDIYSGKTTTKKYVQASQTAPSKASVLLDSSGRFFGRARPQYQNYAVSQCKKITS